MKNFNVPTRSEVNETNQVIFDELEKNLGFVPNLYAYYAKNETALKDYLTLQNRETSLSKREKEIVNLVVSQYNECYYCQSAHTVVAGLNGFTKDQILDIRSGRAPFDEKLDALARFTLATVANRGRVQAQDKEAFLESGYDEATLIDVVLAIGDKTMSNLIHNLAGFEIDFPLAEKLEETAA